MDEKDTLYARWLSGDISQEELVELKASGALEELEAIVKFTDKASLPRYDVNQGLKHLQANLPSKKAKIRRLKPTHIIGIAASILLIIALFFLIPPGSTSIEAAKQDNLRHQFVEGSTVLINDGSSVKYKQRNWEKERTLQLSGEAFFEVEKGAPFIVETDKGQVEVLGTRFNVRAWGGRLNVSCYSGRVRVSGFNETVELSPGQGIILSANAAPIQTTNDINAPTWSSGESSFESEPLNEVFAELERQYNVTVQGSIPNRSLTGTFSNEDLAAALRDICEPQGIDYEISADGKLVSLK